MGVQVAEGFETQKYLLIQSDSVYFGLPIQKVLGIVPGDKLVSVAHLPDCVPGVIRLRSRVIPVVDLQARLSQSNRGKPRPFLIAAAACGEDGQWEVGVTAHSVINVFEIPIINGGQSLVKPISQDKFITGLLQYEGENIRLLSLEQVLFPGGHYFPGNGEQSGNKPTSPPGTFYG